MCGFVGIFQYDSGYCIEEDRLAAMRDTLVHRGPDDSGIFIDKNLGFGFRRLSIIDIEAGHQPMSCPTGRYTIVFNGEIFNYIEIKLELELEGIQFRTHSDTEVLLQAYIRYGPACLDKLNGMFAFAVWDKNERQLFIARDRLGIKPFYFYYSQQRLIFSSEIKAMLLDPGVPREPNHKAIIDYLAFGYSLDESTFFNGINKLLPGHMGHVREDGVLNIQQYWDLAMTPKTGEDEGTYISELKDRITQAIQIHTRSDVAVGCHLSGGLDSSTVTCLTAGYLKKGISSFSGKFDEDHFFDETEYAKAVSEYAGTIYFETTPQSDLLYNRFHEMVWYMDEPSVGPGIIPQFDVCRLAGSKVKVALGGQGGDELFGGYHRYFLTLSDISAHRSQPADMKNLSRLGSLRNKGRMVWQYVQYNGWINTLRKIVNKLLTKRQRASSFEESWFINSRSNDFSNPVFSQELRELLDEQTLRSRFLQYVKRTSATHPLDKMLYHDIKTYLPGLLQVEDRTSMSHSLESRVPLLDYRLVEFAASIPADLKVKGMEAKYIFKQAIKGLIPDKVWKRTDKKGFPTPIPIWFKKNPSFARDILLTKQAISRGLFDFKHVEKLIQHPDQNSWLLWSLLNVEMWFKIFIDRDPKYVHPDGTIKKWTEKSE